MRPTATTRGLLIAAAVCNAVFWVLALVIGSFVGASAVRHPLWIPSQLLHVLGALLVMPAIPSLTAVARQPYGVLATWGGALAMIGSALFAADGVIALSVFPTLASNARMLLEPWGAMNTGLMLATFIVIAAVNMVGWILLGAALWGGRLRNWSIATLIAGAILFNLPPGPVPLFVLALGGLAWSAALVVIALDASPATVETAPIKRMRRS